MEHPKAYLGRRLVLLLLGLLNNDSLGSLSRSGGNGGRLVNFGLDDWLLCLDDRLGLGEGTINLGSYLGISVGGTGSSVGSGSLLGGLIVSFIPAG
jgi:hypothetical protein